jgi:hypothetical protein
MNKILLCTLLALSFNASAQIKTTNGVIGYSVETPTSRAEFLNTSGDKLELRIRYLGITDTKEYFADGTYQEQVGMKLRSMDGCNVIYVMRRINPNPGIVVSIKSNPGIVSTCGDKGYTVLKSVAYPVPKVGDTFTMSATIIDKNIVVKMNGISVITATLPIVTKGNSGIRTDNTKITFTYK